MMPCTCRAAILAALGLAALGSCRHRAPASSMPAALEGPELPPPAVELSVAERKAKVLASMPELEKQFSAFLEKEGIPGMAVGIVVGGELVYANGFGYRDLDSKAPVDADTVFRIASMTKSFTALAVLKLRDEGRLSLEDPVSKYVPELSRLSYPTRDSAPITIRELLSHSAGFPEDNAWGDPRLDMSEAEFSSLLRRGLSFSNAPGTQYEYANLGFALLGRVVQRASGTAYSDYVTQQILRPLGMSATTWDRKHVPAERLAMGYGGNSGPFQMLEPEQDGDSAFRVEKQLSDGAFGAMGGLYTSVRDYARYVAFQLGAWPPRDESDRGPVRRSSVREAQQVARLVGLRIGRAPAGELRASAAGYGFGWGVSESCDFDRVVTHGGGLPGFGSHVYLLPELGVGLFALTNATYSGPSAMLADAARTLKAHGAMEKPRIKASAALIAAQRAVLDLLEQWSEERAAKVFDRTFFQYNPPDQLRDRLRSLRERHGQCRPAGSLEPENALRGKLRLACDRGEIEAHLALSADSPPLVQWVQLHGRLPPNEWLLSVLLKVTEAIQPSGGASIDELLGPAMDKQKADEMISSLGTRHGPCALKRWLDGDGETAARGELRCRQQPLQARIKLDSSGKLEQLDLQLMQEPGSKCP